MKKNKILLLGLLIPFIAGCSNTPQTSSQEASSTNISSQSFSSETNSSVSSSSSQPVEEEIVLLEDEHIITKGSMGGMLIDICNDAFLEENGEFICLFKPTIVNKTIRVISSREESVTIQMDEGSNNFKLITHKPGDSLITIYDANGMIEFNKVAHVRKAYTPETILTKVYYNDVYQSEGIYGNYRFAITEMTSGTATGNVLGADIGEIDKTKSIFTLNYVSTPIESPFEGHFFRFDVNLDKTNSTMIEQIKCIFISKCADVILIYYSSDELLLGMFNVVE